MQELINHLSEKAGISVDQASKAIDALKEFVKGKFPAMSGVVDNLLEGEHNTVSSTDVPNSSSNSVMEKISDIIPGETGEKVEELAKNAAQKAEEAFANVKDKLSGLFGTGK